MKRYVLRLAVTLGIALPIAVVVYVVMASLTDEGPTALGALRVVGVTAGIATVIFAVMSALGAGARRLRQRHH